jgi:hypothetical protein
MDLDKLKVGEISGKGASKMVDPIIEKNHYLRSVPDAPAKHRYLITFGLTGIVGAAVWGKPVARMEDQEDTIELLRFWTADNTPKNTESKALGKMMRDMKGLCTNPPPSAQFLHKNINLCTIIQRYAGQVRGTTGKRKPGQESRT